MSRWYSKEQKIKAVAMVFAGYKYREVSDEIGCSTGTLAQWMKKYEDEVKEKTELIEQIKRKANKQESKEIKKEVETVEAALMKSIQEIEQTQAELAVQSLGRAETAMKIANNLIARAYQQDDGDINFPQLIRAVVGFYAQMVEKGQLLAGQPTERTESRNDHNLNAAGLEIEVVDSREDADILEDSEHG